MQTTETRFPPRRFSDVTWDELPGTGVTTDLQGPVRHWAAQTDLAADLARAQGIPFEWAREVIAAAIMGLPVLIKRRLRGPDPTSVVTELVIPKQVWEKAGHFYARTWGWSGPIYWSTIIDVTVQGAVYEHG